MPVCDKTERQDGTLSASAFAWHAHNNEYRCAAGKPLRSEWRSFNHPRTHITLADTIIYRARQPDCAACQLKSLCCPNMLSRKIHRSIHEDARNVARQIATTYEQSCRQRKKVEMLFAHLKRIMKLDKLRLRGFSGANDEFLLAATAQNLRRMAKWLMPSADKANLLPA